MKITLNMRWKIMLLCLCCTLFALVLQFSFYRQASSTIIYEQARSESQRTLESMQTDILDLVNRIEQSLIRIYTERSYINDSTFPHKNMRK